MKKILYLSLLILSSCSYVITSEYDNNEYLLYSTVLTDATLLKEKCDDPSYIKNHLGIFQYDVNRLQLYTKYIPYNDESYNISTYLKDDIVKFSNRYSENSEPSMGYCLIKLTIAIKTIEKYITVMNEK